MALATGDLERLKSFYVDVLGFEVAAEMGWSDNRLIDGIVGLENSAADSVMLRAGNAYLEIFQYHSPPGAPSDPDRPVCDHGYTHICLDIVDIDAE